MHLPKKRRSLSDMKNIILAFLITVMLSSCTFRTKAFYLEADSVAVAYIADRHTAVKINIDEETLAFLRAESSLEGQALFEDIFSYAPESYQLISDEDYMLRQNIFTSLREISGSTDTLHAFSAFAGDLRKTDFTATINKLSSDFDDTALSRTVGKNTRVFEYHLKNVISPGRSYSENREFIRRWTQQIMRKT